MSLNWNEITPQIVIGSCPMTTDDLERIHEQIQITAILSLQHDECLAHFGIDYYDAMCQKADDLSLLIQRWPMRDFDPLERPMPCYWTLVAPSWEAYQRCGYDLTEQYHDRIIVRAWSLHKQGLHNDPLKDWVQAQSEVLREIFSESNGQ